MMSKWLSRFNVTRLEITGDDLITNHTLISKMFRLQQLKIHFSSSLATSGDLKDYSLDKLTNLVRVEVSGYCSSLNFLPRSTTAHLVLINGHTLNSCIRDKFEDVLKLPMLQSLEFSSIGSYLTLAVDRKWLNRLTTEIPHLTNLSISAKVEISDTIDVNSNGDGDHHHHDHHNQVSTVTSLTLSIEVDSPKNVSFLNYWVGIGSSLKMLKLNLKMRTQKGRLPVEIMKTLVISFKTLEQLSLETDFRDPDFLQDFCSAAIIDGSASGLTTSLRSLELRINTGNTLIDHSPLSIFSGLTSLTIGGRVYADLDKLPHFPKLESLDLRRVFTSCAELEVERLLRNCATLLFQLFASSYFTVCWLGSEDDYTVCG